MNILVTGGAGFIGSNLCEKLLGLDHDVTCLDNFDEYYPPEIKRENIAGMLENEHYTLIEGNILDEKLLKEIIVNGSVDYIFHQAAQPGVRISVIDPIKPLEVNIRGTMNILNVAKEGSVKKVINASSSLSV